MYLYVLVFLLHRWYYVNNFTRLFSALFITPFVLNGLILTLYIKLFAHMNLSMFTIVITSFYISYQKLWKSIFILLNISQLINIICKSKEFLEILFVTEGKLKGYQKRLNALVLMKLCKYFKYTDNVVLYVTDRCLLRCSENGALRNYFIIQISHQ